MRQLSIADLAVAAGTSAETARQFVELGIVEADPEGTFSVGDVRRIRLVLALATSGVPYEAVGDAIRSGRLSLAFVDDLAPAPIPLLPETQSELVERVGMSAELARRLTKIFGTSALPPDAQVRADHAELFELITAAKAEGVPDERLVRVVRVTVEGMRRVVDAHRDFIDDVVIEPLVASGATSAEILSAATGPRGPAFGTSAAASFTCSSTALSTKRPFSTSSCTWSGARRPAGLARRGIGGDRVHGRERIHAPSRGGG
jgi:hypothetical protein